MEVERALADLAEVRDRLASLQRYRGYAGQAAALSGALAVGAGVAQAIVAPQPAGAESLRAYFTIWFSCLFVALAINYGAGLLWYARSQARQERRQTMTAGITILPAVALGAVLTLSIILHGIYWMLPGVWYACYGLGLVAARAMLPKAVAMIGVAFSAIGAILLLTPGDGAPLSWWVMPLGFGIGQMLIGWFIIQEAKSETPAWR
jgi:hypothetical protein